MRTLRTLFERLHAVPGLIRNMTATAAMIVIAIVATVFLFQHYEIKLPWQHEYSFSAVTDKAVGMRASSKHPVTIAGIKVGTVESLDTQRGGTALVNMRIERGHPIYKNAHVEIRTRSPINDIYVALDPGTPSAGELPDGGTIPLTQTSRLVMPSEILNKLDPRTQSAITALVSQADIALKDAPQQLPAGLNSTDQTLKTLRPVVDSLNTRRATLQKLITNLSQISTAAGHNDARLASLISSLQATLSTVSSRDDALNQSLAQLPGLRNDLDGSMTSVNDMTKQLNPTLKNLHSASGELPSTLSRLNDTVKKAGPVVDAAKPVVEKGKPLVADLRPLLGDVQPALDNLKPVTGHLPDATGRLAPWMPNLAAFVYQTSSAFSISDANGGLGRANLNVDFTNPLGSFGPAPETKKQPQGGGK